MSNKEKKILWPALLTVMVCVGALVFAAARPRRPPKSIEMRAATTGVNPAPSSSVLPPIQGNAQDQRIEAELISIRPGGFEPTQITRPKGPFLLAIENRSGLREVEFQLSVEGGARLVQMRRSWERSDWNQVIDPPAGRYVLTETNHPGWKCTISITEQ